MFEALIITLREGIEAALIVGIILTYLRNSGRGHLSRWVLWALAIAILASFAGAIALPRLPINQEAYEGTLMVLAAVMVGSLVIWMAKHARHLKGQIEGRIDQVSGASGAAAGWGMFALTFVFVIREGVETILFLAAVNLTTDGLMTLAGGLTGLTLATVFGVAFVQGAVRLDLGRFFRITGIVLMIFALNLLAGGIHEFAEVGVIPIGPKTMSVLGPLVKSQSIFLATFLAVPLLLLLIPSSRKRAEERAWDELEAPERRLRRAEARRGKIWRTVAAVAGLAVIGSLTVSATTSQLPLEAEPPMMVAQQTGEVRVPLEGLRDGSLHRFGVDLDGAVIRFLVMDVGGKLKVSFDACQICGARGYVQDGPHVVCLACAADINPATIGTPGGCNPLPLAFRIEADELVIQVDDLAALRPSFLRPGGA